MSKKTFRKISTRGIRGSFSRFLAIVSIVALGVGFLAGLLATAPDMKNSANAYFKDSNLYDFYIQSDIGFDKTDLEKIKGQDFVKDAMAIYQEDIISKDSETENIETRVFHMDTRDENILNKITLVEGRFAENENECVVETPEKFGYKAKIGEKYTLDNGNTYEVVGIGKSPMFISEKSENTNIGKGTISLGMYILPQENSEIFTTIYATANTTTNTFTTEYENELNDIVLKLEGIEDASLEERLKRIEQYTLSFDVKKPQWHIATRLDNNGINNFKSDVEKVSAIATIFPVFFFFVAALIVLTTMNRMIEEERTQVGTLKSLGYTNRVIRNHYLIYGFIATMIGSVIGLPVGFTLFPKVISNAYNMMYTLPAVKLEFIWPLALVIVAVTLVCIMSTTLLACRGELKEKPATLLQPKAPAAGKRILLERITPIWKRIKFTRKVTFRNLFRYKKRFLMTVVGVAGCFSLLIAAFGVRDSIGNIDDLQFEEIFKYDMLISVDDTVWKEDKTLFKEEMLFLEKKVDIQAGNKKDNLTLEVPENLTEFADFVTLRERASQNKLTLDDSGVQLSEKISEVMDIEVGDTVVISGDGMAKTEVKVTGIFENYVDNRMFMSKEFYEKNFGKISAYNVLFAKLTDDVKKSNDINQIVSDVMEKDGVNYAMATEIIRTSFNDSVKSIDYIVMVLILSAGALSIIVLYNLTNINICERKKELATIKVLGFYEREVSSYIFREIHILAAIGILVGIPVGIILHQFIIKTAEVGGMMFGREIYLTSFALAIGLTVVFTGMVNLIMRRSIRKINMVESMKAND